jgi:hypothetical protein
MLGVDLSPVKLSSSASARNLPENPVTARPVGGDARTKLIKTLMLPLEKANRRIHGFCEGDDGERRHYASSARGHRSCGGLEIPKFFINESDSGFAHLGTQTLRKKLCVAVDDDLATNLNIIRNPLAHAQWPQFGIAKNGQVFRKPSRPHPRDRLENSS